MTLYFISFIPFEYSKERRRNKYGKRIKKSRHFSRPINRVHFSSSTLHSILHIKLNQRQIMAFHITDALRNPSNLHPSFQYSHYTVHHNNALSPLKKKKNEHMNPLDQRAFTRPAEKGGGGSGQPGLFYRGREGHEKANKKDENQSSKNGSVFAAVSSRPPDRAI